jgi:hypothetical protein
MQCFRDKFHQALKILKMGLNAGKGQLFHQKGKFSHLPRERPAGLLINQMFLAWHPGQVFNFKIIAYLVTYFIFQ